MRCDICKEVGELTPVTVVTLNDGFQPDSQLEDAHAPDICEECTVKVTARWNDLITTMTAEADAEPK